MKFLHTLLFSALLMAVQGLHGQDAKATELLDKLSEKTRKHSTITSDFVFRMDDQAADVHQSQQGSLKMKGKKYFIVLGENEIYSDGTTRWTYNREMNEVYIDHASGGEGVLNPSDIYTIWETGFKQYYEGSVSENGRNYEVIKLVPTKPADKPFHTVKLYIDESKLEVGKIVILGKQGDNYTYEVKSFKADVPYTENVFAFDASKHPGVVKIDNR